MAPLVDAGLLGMPPPIHKLRVAQGRADGNAAELTRVRKARDEIAKQRQELVAALAQRDRTLEAELRAYRDAVTAIATSPDPKTQELLRCYANGEQREALAESDVLADADLATRNKASAIANAVKRRPWAMLAIQTHDNGKMTLEEVVQKFEKLTQLDPGMTEAWVSWRGGTANKDDSASPRRWLSWPTYGGRDRLLRRGGVVGGCAPIELEAN